MIDGREPNYICLDTRVIALVRRLQDQDRLAFFDGICAAYAVKLAGEDSYTFPDSIMGELMKQAADTMIDGFDKYMGRVNANLSGKKRDVDPMGSQWVANGTQSNQDQSNKDQYNRDQINQIKAQLMTDGYTDSEINSVISRCSGKRVNNLMSYIRQSIDNERKKKQKAKRVPAQEYGQRDYSSVQDELIAQQDKEMEEYLKKEKGDDIR